MKYDDKINCVGYPIVVNTESDAIQLRHRIVKTIKSTGACRVSDIFDCGANDIGWWSLDIKVYRLSRSRGYALSSPRIIPQHFLDQLGG